MISKLLAFALTGAVPVAIVAATSTKFLATGGGAQQNPPKVVSVSPQGESTREEDLTVSKQLQEEREHDDCQDKHIKVIVQKGQEKKTVPLKEYSQYSKEGYELVGSDYEAGKCSRRASLSELLLR